MDRRSFLRFLLSTAAAEAVDFEKLLWVPKSIVVVPAMPAHAHSYFITPQWVTREVMLNFKNKLQFGPVFEHYGN